jgi:hypothetical protein
MGDLTPQHLRHRRRPQRRAGQKTPGWPACITGGRLSAMDAISRSVTDLLDDNPVQWNLKWFQTPSDA